MKQQRAPERLCGVRKSLEEDEQRLPGWIEQKHRERGELKRRLQDEDARRKRALVKEAKAAERKKDREEEAEAKEFCRGLAANWPRPRSKAVVRSEAELRKLGGVREMVERKDGIKPRITFGPVGETRFIFMPEGAAWRVALDAKAGALKEELKRELNRSRRNLWNVPKLEQQPDIAATEQEPAAAEDKQREGIDRAVHAVDALLSCIESFKGLPSNKQQADEVQFAIIATLQVLERDVENDGRKLQVAFDWLTGQGTPSQIVKLHDHALMLACDLQRPPYKSELRADFELRGRIQIQPTNFATLLRRAGLGWLPKNPG